MIMTNESKQQAIATLDSKLATLITLAQRARIKLILDISQDCNECGNHAKAIKENREHFFKAIEGLIEFKKKLKNL